MGRGDGGEEGRDLLVQMIGFLFWLGVDICMRPGSEEDFDGKRRRKRHLG
jgi:hypothetical protein